MAGIQLSGLSSGLDTETLISGLMSVERAPRARILLQQAAAKARQTGLQQVEDKLKALKLASDDLASSLTWNLAQKATSSDATKATATLTAGAAPGTYAVNVTQLATNEQRTYTYTPKSSDRSLTLNGQSLLITANSSLDTIVSTINGNSAYGVSAVNVSGKLVLTENKTGTPITMNMNGFTVLSEDTASARPAKQATYTIDGTSYTSPTNTISATSGATGIITGVDLQLASAGSFNVVVDPPAVDKSAITNK